MWRTRAAPPPVPGAPSTPPPADAARPRTAEGPLTTGITPWPAGRLAPPVLSDGGRIMHTRPRLFVISLLVSLALLSLPILPALAEHTEGGRTTSRGRLEEEAGTWKTWAIAAG